MSIVHEDVLNVPDGTGGTIPVSLAYAATTPAPAIVIAPSVFGYDDDTREVARKYAARGYLVATPDLFWRIDPGPLAVADDGERARAFARLAKLEFEEAFAGFERVIDAVCRLPQADGRYAIVGICLGGEYAFVAAARLRPAAIATLHGTAMGKHLEEADTIACPLSLHFGEGDEIVPMSEVAAISAAVGGRERATIVTYAGAGHGFSLPRMPGYDAAAAASGWAAVSAIVDEMRSGPM